MLSLMRLLSFLFAVVIVLSGASCSARPSVAIVLPSGGSVSAGDITVEVRVSGFTISDRLVKPNVAGEGHLHYFYDFEPPTAPGVPAVAPEGRYAATISTSYTWKDVPSGTHSFSVELVNNDNTPLQPPVLASITITAG
jgi:hypothetical protein